MSNNSDEAKFTVIGCGLLVVIAIVVVLIRVALPPGGFWGI